MIGPPFNFTFVGLLSRLPQMCVLLIPRRCLASTQTRMSHIEVVVGCGKAIRADDPFRLEHIHYHLFLL
jgi:hypothetical protein